MKSMGHWRLKKGEERRRREDYLRMKVKGDGNEKGDGVGGRRGHDSMTAVGFQEWIRLSFPYCDLNISGGDDI